MDGASTGSAVLCAHSAFVALTIGGRSISYHLNYGFWADAPHHRYLSGKELSVAALQLIAIEETQQAGPHMLDDVARRLRTAHVQVSYLSAIPM